MSNSTSESTKPVKARTRQRDVFEDHTPIAFNAKSHNGEPCRIEYSSEPDSLGRRSFTVRWYEDHGEFWLVRGQCFFTQPAKICTAT